MRVISALSYLVCLSQADSSGEGLEIYDGFNVNLTLLDDQNVQFDIVMKANTWLGFTLGESQMEVGTDFVRCIAAGQRSKFRDEHVINSFGPGLDYKNNLKGSFTLQDEEVIFQLRRQLDTGDSQQDFVIPLDTQFTMGWFVNSQANRINQQHDNQGQILDVVLDSTKIGIPLWSKAETITEPIDQTEDIMQPTEESQQDLIDEADNNEDSSNQAEEEDQSQPVLNDEEADPPQSDPGTREGEADDSAEESNDTLTDENLTNLTQDEVTDQDQDEQDGQQIEQGEEQVDDESTVDVAEENEVQDQGDNEQQASETQESTIDETTDESREENLEEPSEVTDLPEEQPLDSQEQDNGINTETQQTQGQEQTAENEDQESQNGQQETSLLAEQPVLSHSKTKNSGNPYLPILIVIIVAVVLTIVGFIAGYIICIKKEKNQKVVAADKVQQKSASVAPTHSAVNTTERTLNTVVLDEEDFQNNKEINDQVERLFKQGVMVEKEGNQSEII